MKLKDIAEYVTDRISSDAIDLDYYVTTDSLLQNKAGRMVAVNLPPQVCTLTHFRKGDILIGNIRPYLKKIWMSDIDGGCNADVLVIRAKDGHSPCFIYALLLQDAFYEYAMKGAKGSKMPRGDKDQIMRYEIPTLSSTEESIGKFIVDIRDKINVLTQINRNLEAMARQLYDYWFVQFDFPDENGKPYKSSGGKMVWNEKLKREIPEGWTVKRIKDTTDVLLGGTPDTTNNDYWDGTIPWLNSGEVAEFPILSSEKTITELGLAKSATVYAPKGSVTLSITRHLRPSILGINACINQSVVAIKETDEMRNAYLYPYLLNEIPRLMSLRTGAQQPHINKEIVEDSTIIMGAVDLMQDYYSLAQPLFESIIGNAKEIQTLIILRNELLPLLMNGQVSVMRPELNCDLSHD